MLFRNIRDSLTKFEKTTILRRIRISHLMRLPVDLKKALLAPVPIRRRWNYFLISLSARLGLKRSLGKPIHLTLEPTNVCDQKCPICETGNGTLGRRPAMLRRVNFNRILEQFDDTLEQLFLYFMGETFLNKDAYKMIRDATERGIWVSLCTNGNFIEPKRLVESGISEVAFQIGGMTQETHQIYRVDGVLEKTLQALEETILLRNSLGISSDRMRIKCGFILQRHNEHDVREFVDYCDRVGVDQYDIIGSCIRSIDEWDLWMPTNQDYWLYDGAAYKAGILAPKVRPNNHCGWIYSTMTIQVDGSAVPCCNDPKGKYVLGNVFNDDPYTIWNNSSYQKLRSNVSSHSNSFELCSLCSSYNIPPIGRNRELTQC